MTPKYFCRTCHGLRNHVTLFEKILREELSEYTFQFIDKYLVIQCQGCETISFLNDYGDTSMVRGGIDGESEYYTAETIYPQSLPKGKELDYAYYLPNNIRHIYNETITSFKAKAYILTAGGFRAIIEAICNHLKIKKANLSERIDSLHEKGILTLKESKRLHSIRFVGNDALHEIEIPEVNQLYIVLDIVNHILENLFIQDKKIKDGLDSIIDEYDEFIKIIRSKLPKDSLGETISLSKILGKGLRLLKDKKVLSEFEGKLKEEIKSKKIDFLSIEKDGKETIYKIEKVTNSFFGL